jgi:hypothetical protein
MKVARFCDVLQCSLAGNDCHTTLQSQLQETVILPVSKIEVLTLIINI